MLYPESEIHGFEADESTFEILKNNIESNGLSKVNLVKAAVYNKDGFTDFYSIAGASLESSLFYPAREMNDQVSVTTVPCIRLSKFLDRPIDFVKLNIEGAACEVLDEISSKIRMVREMDIEFEFNTPEYGSKFLKMLKILEDNGFRYVITGNSVPPFSSLQGKPYHIYMYAYQVE